MLSRHRPRKHKVGQRSQHEISNEIWDIKMGLVLFTSTSVHHSNISYHYISHKS